MVSLTNLVISKLRENNRRLEKNIEGVSYVMETFMTKALEKDEFELGSFEYITLKDGLFIKFESGEEIRLSTSDKREFHIDFNLDNEYISSDFKFYKSGFLAFYDYSLNGIDYEDIYFLRDNLFGKIRKENGKKVYSVSANSIGFYRSDKSSYQLRQDYPPVEYNGVFDRVHNFFDSQVCVREFDGCPTYATYKDLDGYLNQKLIKEEVRARKRVLNQ